MTDDQIGSVGEEAAKLLSALQDWARESGHQQAAHASAAAGGLGASLRGLNEHVGHGPDCRYCPVCQAINLVRDTSPEVRQHLAAATSSLLQAVQGMLAGQLPSDHPSRRGEPVQKIDLEDEAGWDEE